MRIASFRNHSGDIRIALCHHGQLIDLGAAFEKFLVDRERCDSVTASQIAEERMPGSMLALILRGNEGQADLRLIAEYVRAVAETQEMPSYSPSGRRITCLLYTSDAADE